MGLKQVSFVERSSLSRRVLYHRFDCVSPHHTEETESELVGVRRERDKLRRQKEEEVSALNARLRAIERSYDAILEVSIYTTTS